MTSEQIIKAFGGSSEVARICECTPQAVSQWRGADKYGNARSIPKSRLLHLRLLKPELFLEIAQKDRKASQKNKV